MDSLFIKEFSLFNEPLLVDVDFIKTPTQTATELISNPDGCAPLLRMLKRNATGGWNKYLKGLKGDINWKEVALEALTHEYTNTAYRCYRRAVSKNIKSTSAWLDLVEFSYNHQKQYVLFQYIEQSLGIIDKKDTMLFKCVKICIYYGNYQFARRMLKLYLQDSYQTVLVKFANMEFGAGNLFQAKMIFRFTLNKFDTPYVYRSYLQFVHNHGELQDGVYCVPLLKKYPTLNNYSPILHFYIKLGNYDNVVSFMNYANVMLSMQHYWNLAIICIRYELSVGRIDEAYVRFNSIYIPHIWVRYLWKGQFEFEFGHYVSADRYFNKALELCNKTDRIHIVRQIFNNYKKIKATRKARTLLQNSLYSWKVYLMLIEYELENNKPITAKHLANIACGKYPNIGLIWAHVIRMCNPKAYRRTIDAALKHDPFCGALYTELGKRSVRKGSLEVARRHFRKAIRISPQYRDAYIELRKLFELTNAPITDKIKLENQILYSRPIHGSAWE